MKTIIRIDTEIILALFQYTWTPRRQKAEIEGVLCSANFEDVIHIAPKGLKTTQVDSNYQDTLKRNMKRVYIYHVRVAQMQAMKSMIRSLIMNRINKY